MEALPGSLPALSHASSDIETGRVAAGAERYNERSAVPVTPRSRAQVARFFDGMQVADPGVVPLGTGTRPAPAVRPPGLPTSLRGGPQALQAGARRDASPTGQPRDHGTAEACGVGAAVWWPWNRIDAIWVSLLLP